MAGTERFLVEGQVGPVAKSDGSYSTVRIDKTGSMVFQNSHGEYYEAVSRGAVFSATNQAAQAVSVALATTYTGLCLSNPVNSGKNLSLIAASYALSVAPAGIASLHLIGNVSTTNVTHTAAVTPMCNFLNTVTPTGKVDSQATIPTPVYLMPLIGGFTAGALPSSPVVYVDLRGLFVIPPGGFIAIGALTAVTGFGGLVWEELTA